MGLAINSTNVAIPNVPPRINTTNAIQIDTIRSIVANNPIIIFCFLSNLNFLFLLLFFCLTCRTRTIAKTYTIGKGPTKKSKKIEITASVPKINDDATIRTIINNIIILALASMIFFLLSSLMFLILSNLIIITLNYLYNIYMYHNFIKTF